MAIQLRRGTQWQRLASEEVLEAGQPYLDTDTGYLFVGDGTTQLKSLSRVIRPKAKKPPVVSIGFGGNPANLSVLKSTSGSLSEGTAEDIYRMRQGDIIRVNCAMGIGGYYPLTLAYIVGHNYKTAQDTSTPPVGISASWIPECDNFSGNYCSTYYFWGQIYGGLWGCLTVVLSDHPDTGVSVIAEDGISWQAETGDACRYLITDKGYTASQQVYGLLKTTGIDCSSLISAQSLNATSAIVSSLSCTGSITGGATIIGSSITGTTSVIGDTVGVGSSTSYKTVHPLYKHEVTAYSQDSSNQVVARVFFYSADPDASTANAAYYYGIDALTGNDMFSNNAFSSADDSDYGPFQSVSGYIQIGSTSFTSSKATYPIIGFASDYANAKAGFWYLDGSHYIKSKILAKSAWSWTDKVSQVK